MTVRRDDDVFVCCREVEYLKKETEQQQVQEQSQATHKEETDNLQEKVSHNDKYIDFELNICILEICIVRKRVMAALSQLMFL